MAIRRRRPFARFGTPTGTSADENLSFFSEHTTIAFAGATATGMVATLRGHAWAPAAWVVGGLFAAATGYFRIAADKHYLSDVLTGFGVGSATGILVPLLLHMPATRKMPVVPVPSASHDSGSISLLGTW